MSDSSLRQPPLDRNKAYGAGGLVLLGGALTKIVFRIVNYKWPGMLPDDLTDPIDVVIVSGLAFLGAYLPPHNP